MMSDAMAVVAFWAGCVGTLYAYVGFPALSAVLSTAGRWRRTAAGDPNGTLPSVTVIIPAYNEERHLAAKIRNQLAAEYPRNLMQILVVSDASTDRTDDIARSFEAEGVRLIVQNQRRGKTAGLNRAMTEARGDIVVFTDANAMFPPLAIGRLVRYFRNPAIGLVTGYTNYTMSESGEMARTTNIYTSLERAIKIGESQWGYCVGADGAIFAMRRSLYRPLRDDDINDFVLPLTVIEQQSSCVFAADAHCSEAPGNNLESEFRRQSRITNRTLLALWRHRHLLNPMRFGWFSFFLLSHKVFRFLVPAFLLLSAVSLAWLAQSRSVYQVLALGALAAIVLAADATASSAIRRSGLDRLLGFLNTFLMINLAVLLGWWHFLRGQRDTMWQHDRLQGENT